MSYRASLRACVEAAVTRLQNAQTNLVIITRLPHSKYYTLYHPAEWEARLINRPHTPERIVLCCTGGELASMIGTAQMTLNLGTSNDTPS